MEGLLARGRLDVVGRLADSSNGALLVEVVAGRDRLLAIHKPIAFERPLWDFPDGHLAWREVAAHRVAMAAGLGHVPPTILRTGPWGPGSLQVWVGRSPVESEGPGNGETVQGVESLVTVCEPEAAPSGWHVVLQGQDGDGQEVVLAHSPEDGVADLALLDAILNNTDRKGGHILSTGGQVWGFDHGVTLGVEPKLRTVLWGWAGSPLASRHVEMLDRLQRSLTADRGLGEELAPLLTIDEVSALLDRVARLRSDRAFPVPSPHWPAIPWPAL